MSKPRIIIADTDINYIIPLQLKFIEEFFGKIDLEIITDKSYFAELFSSPQTADILIVSEDLYDTSLQRHNISNCFVMMEQYEEGMTDELNINRLSKYTSVQKIFNEITAKSLGLSNIESDAKRKTQIILVYSACGGVGRTTVAMGISTCLTKNYKKVLYINADRLQTFQRMLENQSAISSVELYTKLAVNNKNVYKDLKHVIRKEIFSYLPPFKAALMSLGVSYEIYETIAVSAKVTDEYDYIVIDADTTFDEGKASLLNIADKVIIITEQSNTSVYSTNLLVSNINCTNSDKYIFVCNKFDKNNSNAAISSDKKANFVVNEYINKISDCENKSCEELSRESGIQKTAFLIL